MFKVISVIGQVFVFPLRVIKTFIGVPNVRILYKSGNSHKVCINTFNIKFGLDNTLSELTWEVLNGHKILYINVDEIEAIFKLW